MSDAINHNGGQPKQPSNSPPNVLVSFTNFENQRLPIYWGPDQDTTDSYQPPLVNNWNLQIQLRIPKMGRFSFYNSVIDTDKFKDTPSPPPPPPPPPPLPIDYCYCVQTSARLLFTFPGTGCSKWVVYWATYYNDGLGNTFLASNNSFDSSLGIFWSSNFTCTSTGGPTSPACHPACNVSFACGCSEAPGRVKNNPECAGGGQC
jgi:hypothetical protein